MLGTRPRTFACSMEITAPRAIIPRCALSACPEPRIRDIEGWRRQDLSAVPTAGRGTHMVHDNPLPPAVPSGRRGVTVPRAITAKSANPTTYYADACNNPQIDPSRLEYTALARICVVQRTRRPPPGQQNEASVTAYRNAAPRRPGAAPSPRPTPIPPRLQASLPALSPRRHL